jgi:hypothetical protein
MPETTKKPTRRNWGFRNGPGLLIFITAGLLVITFLIWTSGVYWRGAAAVVFVAILSVLLVFARQINCTFNLDQQLIHLQQRSIWKKTYREIPFNDVETVGVVSSSSGTWGRTHRVVLALQSGEQVCLTAHPSSGKIPKELLARRISNTLNQFRLDPVNPALNGVFRVSRIGQTREVAWQVDLITANDSIPVTHWFSSQAPFLEGFLLLTPGHDSSSAGKRKLSRSVLFFYRQHLRALGLEARQAPGFKEAQLLGKGDHTLGRRFSCLTNDPSAAERWLNTTEVERLIRWLDKNPLPGGKAEVEPHLLATPEGLRLIFRCLYYQDDDIRQIADLGTSLIEKRLKA